MTNNFTYRRLDKSDAAVLLVDHQSGLCNLVQDFSPDEFKNNVLALADLAKYFKLPTILTTSFEDGPNGPILPELKKLFPDAPYVARPGNINAWDNEDFVKAVKATGKKQLIIAGVVTEVCVAFPTLSALEEGYEVFVVTDASGTFNLTTRNSAWSRMEAAGAQLMGWFGTACELHRDWRNDIDGLGQLFSNHIPAYANLFTSYNGKRTWTTSSIRHDRPRYATEFDSSVSRPPDSPRHSRPRPVPAFFVPREFTADLSPGLPSLRL
jgi:nicotinamidase-related amidase